MKKIWQHYEHPFCKMSKKVLGQLLVLSLPLIPFFSPAHADDIKITLENRGFDADLYLEPHIIFTNAAGPVATSIFLVPPSGEMIKKTTDQYGLLHLFHDPRSWKAYMRGVPANSADEKLKIIFTCSIDRTQLKDQNLREIKMIVSTNGCEVYLYSDSHGTSDELFRANTSRD